MKKYQKIIIFAFALILPVLSFAAIVNCGNNPQFDPTTGKVNGECNFRDFVNILNNFVNWIISIAGLIFTIVAIYGGFLYMTSGENPSNKQKAKSILYSVLIGFLFVICAWLIVYSIINYIVDSTQQGTVLKFIK